VKPLYGCVTVNSVTVNSVTPTLMQETDSSSGSSCSVQQYALTTQHNRHRVLKRAAVAIQQQCDCCACRDANTKRADVTVRVLLNTAAVPKQWVSGNVTCNTCVYYSIICCSAITAMLSAGMLLHVRLAVL
jgi:hypothetical protein